MDTDINSHADETVIKSYANIPLDDLSRFLLVSTLYSHGCVNPFHTKSQTTYPPSCEGSKHLPRFEESKHPPQYLLMIYRDIARFGTLVLKLSVNAIQSPLRYYQIIQKKNFLVAIGD